MAKNIDVENSQETESPRRSPEAAAGEVREFGTLDTTAEAVEDAREARSKLSELKAAAADQPSLRTGDFANAEKNLDGQIILSASDQAAVQEQITKLQHGARNFAPLLNGTRIAAEYDIKVNNFSTHTKIIELPDGRKAFAVFAHPGSSLHRSLDGVMKHAAGLRMGKVSRDNWKRAFQEHARIPQIECQDPYTVLMPFIPNVNAYDVLANNKDIKDFGAMTWAGKVDASQKEVLLKSVVTEISAIHSEGIAWGECILPNLIFDDEQRAIMCDPEVRYDASVPLPEAQARDLMDIVLSSCAALRKSEGKADYASTVKLMLDTYADQNIIAVLQGLSDAPFTFSQGLSFWNEKLRTGVKDRAEYDAIRQAISSYSR